MKSIGLYLHIPFCKKICPYCAFYKLKWDKDLEIQFVEALLKELHYYKNEIDTISIKSIFFGGGTPTLLSLPHWERIMTFIFESFKIEPECEITTEANPETLTKENLSTLQQLGINRMSVGIQSLNQQELTYLGREHTTNSLHNTLDLITSHGPKNINYDLIFGTETETTQSVMESLHTLVNYNPTHISTYALSIEPHTLFHKKNIKPTPPEYELETYKAIIHYLNENNYTHYEVSAFAKPGFECIHNLIYWTYQEFIGVGPSANSFFQEKRYTQHAQLSEYLKNPIPSTLIKTTSFSTQKEQMQEYVISLLRLKKGLSFTNFKERFGDNFLDLYQPQIETLLSQTLITIEHDHVKTTEKGLYLLNEVLLEFID